MKLLAEIINNYLPASLVKNNYQRPSASAGCNISNNAVGLSDYLLTNIRGDLKTQRIIML